MDHLPDAVAWFVGFPLGVALGIVITREWKRWR